MGMLFDHGCDSVTSVLFALVMVRVLQYPPNFQCILLIASVCGNVYYNFLQEFFTGKLQMSEISGPDDANFGIISLCVMTGILGTDMWLLRVNPGNYLTEPVTLLKLISYPVYFLNALNLSIQLGLSIWNAKMS